MSEKLSVSIEGLRALVGADNTGPKHVFGVTFIKRTTGEPRRMRCFLGVKKHLKGGKPAYNFKSKGLLPVWIPEEDRRPDGKDNGYRAVPADKLIEVRANGKTYQVEDGYFVEV